MIIQCPRCQGTGVLPQFMHIDNGICFLCEGSKEIECNEIELPESAVVCYQDNRNVTEHNGQFWPEEWRIERFSIVVNGGSHNRDGWEFVTEVTHQNRSALRELWTAAKRAGCACRSFN